MFSYNDKISLRQTFRLFLFAFVGISTLIAPTVLSQLMGSGGWSCILIGGLLGGVYLGFLALLAGRMKVGLPEYMDNRLPVGLRVVLNVLLVVHCVVIAACCVQVFSRLMHVNLVRSGKYGMIATVIVLCAGYAVYGGIERWARCFELLFWFIVIPLVLMLSVGVFNMDIRYWEGGVPQDVTALAKGSIMVFLFLETAFWMLCLPRYLHPKNCGRPLWRVIAASMAAAVLLLLAVHQIVLGNFGAPSLAKMDYPVVTLMSTIQVSGNFIKRLDAIMLAVWFYTLFALMTMHLFFGIRIAAGWSRQDDLKRKKVAVVLMLAVTLILSLVCGEKGGGLLQWLLFYIGWGGSLLLILIPCLTVLIGELRKNEVKIK